MSNGRIDYSLGLETSGLLGKLVGVNAAFEVMGKVIGAVGTVSRGVFSQIEKGGALNDLANRTGESVKNLYALEYAFKQSGVAAASVPGTLLRFQKSLSGLGEMGENTAEAFAVMGLNIASLRNLDSPAGLEKVFSGLNKLDRNTAADVASRIFGRGSSGDILQLARDSAAFADSLKEVADRAGTMQRFAGIFDNIGDQLGKIGGQVEGSLLNLAVNIGPAINGMLTTLASGDFKKFGDIVELSLVVAFENATNFFARALAAVAASAPSLFSAAQSFGAGAIGGSLAKGYSAIMWDMRQTEADVAQNPALKAQKQAQADYWWGVMQETENLSSDFAAEGAAKMRKGFQDAMSAQGPVLFGPENASRLRELLAGFGPAIGAGPRPPGSPFVASNLLSSFGKSAFGDANALERVGASFGVGPSTVDVQRKQLTTQQQILIANHRLLLAVQKMDRQFDPLVNR